VPFSSAGSDSGEVEEQDAAGLWLAGGEEEQGFSGRWTGGP